MSFIDGELLFSIGVVCIRQTSTNLRLATDNLLAAAVASQRLAANRELARVRENSISNYATEQRKLRIGFPKQNDV